VCEGLWFGFTSSDRTPNVATTRLAEESGKHAGTEAVCHSSRIYEQRGGIGSRAMLGKCINLLCFASFRNFADGNLFQLETDPPAQAKGIEYFWLCAECSVEMTLHLAQNGNVATTGLPDAIPGPPQVARSAVDRENRRFLSKVSFLPRSHPKNT